MLRHAIALGLRSDDRGYVPRQRWHKHSGDLCSSRRWRHVFLVLQAHLLSRGYHARDDFLNQHLLAHDGWSYDSSGCR